MAAQRLPVARPPTLNDYLAARYRMGLRRTALGTTYAKCRLWQRDAHAMVDAFIALPRRCMDGDPLARHVALLHRQPSADFKPGNDDNWTNFLNI